MAIHHQPGGGGGGGASTAPSEGVGFLIDS